MIFFSILGLDDFDTKLDGMVDGLTWMTSLAQINGNYEVYQISPQANFFQIPIFLTVTECVFKSGRQYMAVHV